MEVAWRRTSPAVSTAAAASWAAPEPEDRDVFIQHHTPRVASTAFTRVRCKPSHDKNVCTAYTTRRVRTSVDVDTACFKVQSECSILENENGAERRTRCSGGAS